MGKKNTAKHRAAADPTCSVYVVELDKAILSKKKFIKKNPDHEPRKSCLYVGMTACTPDERFKQHKEGYRSSRYVREYGRWLRRRLYEK